MSDICWLLRARRERPRKRRAADQQLTGEKGALGATPHGVSRAPKSRRLSSSDAAGTSRTSLTSHRVRGLPASISARVAAGHQALRTPELTTYIAPFRCRRRWRSGWRIRRRTCRAAKRRWRGEARRRLR
jgi:hypothetical protein